MDPGPGFEYGLACGLGALVGLTELVTRYRDSYSRLLRLRSFHLYWIGNGAVSGLALLILHSGLLVVGDGVPARWLLEVFVAAFGGMLLLRSALMVVQVKGQDVQVGPGAAMSALLDSIEEVVNRNQAAARSRAVGVRMDGLAYDKAVAQLPALCLSVMKQTSEAAVTALLQQVEELRDHPADDRVKLLMLGAALIEYCGKDVLRGSVGSARAALVQSAIP